MWNSMAPAPPSFAEPATLLRCAQPRMDPRREVGVDACAAPARALDATVCEGGRRHDRRRPRSPPARDHQAVSDLGVVVVGLAIAIGVVGVVVPVLPGSLLAWGAIAVWALAVGSTTAWAVLAIATLLIGGAQVVKLVVPGRRLRDAGVPRRSIVAGLLLAVAGFFL